MWSDKPHRQGTHSDATSPFSECSVANMAMPHVLLAFEFTSTLQLRLRVLDRLGEVWIVPRHHQFPQDSAIALDVPLGEDIITHLDRLVLGDCRPRRQATQLVEE